MTIVPADQSWTACFVTAAEGLSEILGYRDAGDQKNWLSVFSRLAEIMSYGPDWDDLGSSAPNQEAANEAWRVAIDLRHRGSSAPDRVMASQIGNVLFEWVQGAGDLVQYEFSSDELEIITFERGKVSAQSHSFPRLHHRAVSSLATGGSYTISGRELAVAC